VWAVSKDEAQQIFANKIIRDCRRNGWRFAEWQPNGTTFIGPIVVTVPEEIITKCQNQ
jgi:hypothetical protein